MIKQVLLISITLIFLSCNRNVENNIVEKKNFISTLINNEIIKFDYNSNSFQINTYYEENVLNTSIAYDKNGKIDYSETFYINLYPKEDTLFMDDDEFILLTFYDRRGIDSGMVTVDYFDYSNGELILIDTISNSSKEQMQGVEQINTSIASLDQATQNNAQVALQTKEIATQTSTMASDLVDETSKNKF